MTVDLWWVDIPEQPPAFFDSSAAAWTHAGRAAERLLAAQVFRGTFALRPNTTEHVGDFTSMVESFRRYSMPQPSKDP